MPMTNRLGDDETQARGARALGREIAAARTRKRWTQARLSTESRVSESSIKQYEAGKREPVMSTLLRVAHVLDADPADWLRIVAQAMQENGG